ncbi:MAG: family 1 encapsulin nanocompartment shell protein, partial [bacterium]
MDIFKKTLAPITDEAWKEINEQATSVFKNVLSARKFVDVEGPHGLDFGAVARGRLHVPEGQEKNPVKFGIHQVHPLIECRIPFTLDIWELDNSVRGAEDIELEPLEKAAREIALFEEKAIY